MGDPCHIVTNTPPYRGSLPHGSPVSPLPYPLLGLFWGVNTLNKICMDLYRKMFAEIFGKKLEKLRYLFGKEIS